MAQTKRKRRTKHRGTPVGTIESRGRTGRKPTSGERAKGGKADTRAARMERLTQPPTWKGALTRAGIAAAILVVFLIALFDRPPEQAFLLGVLALGMYVPMGYYTDLVMYRRRMAKQGKTPAK